jgi:hypothetical protein
MDLGNLVGHHRRFMGLSALAKKTLVLKTGVRYIYAPFLHVRMEAWMIP